MRRPPTLNVPLRGLLLLALFAAAGCGTTKTRSATEQLLVSNAVDLTIAQIDFSKLSGKKVFLDTQFIKNVKGIGFVNSEYVISSLRQQMIGANCLMQDKQEDADFIVEARVGALGSDDHEVSYGIPASNTLSAVSTVVPAAPPIPTIPEVSVAKNHRMMGAFKIGVFAYERETRARYWQSGIVQANSTAKHTWVFGAGPFESGTMYKETRFAGERVGIAGLLRRWKRAKRPAAVPYDDEVYFVDLDAEHPAEKSALAESASSKSPAANTAN